MADIGSIRATLILNSQNFNRNMDAARASMEQTGRSAERTAKSIDKIHKASLVLGGAIVTTIGASVKVAADFEQKMADVKSISGASADDMQRLSDLAKDLGSSTMYSAGEVASAMEELLKSGLSVDQVINGGLKGALDMAAASGISLADAATIASQALNTFKNDNLSVSKAADILSGAANASASDVEQLKYGLSAVGSVAAGAGMNFQDTATALAILSQNSLEGSDAGTSLKSMLMNLSPSTKEATKEFEKLGIITKDGTNKFYDANGKLKSLAGVTDVLRSALLKLNPKQQGEALKTMFGSDGIRAGLVLMKDGSKAVNDMWAAMSNVKAADVAKVKMDTLKGAFEQFKGAVETTGLKIGENFLPELTNIVKKVTEAVGALDDIKIANLESALAFGGTASAVALFGSSIAKAVSAAKLLFSGPTGWVIVGASLLAGAIAGVVTKSKEMEDAQLKNIKAGLEANKSLDATIKAYDDLKMKSHLTNDEFGRYLDLQADLSKTSDPKAIAKIKDEMDKLQKKSGLSNDELSDMIGYNKTLVDKTPEVKKAISQQGQAYVDNTKKVKEYNQAQLDSLYDKLNIERIKTETKYKDLLSDEKDLIKERKDEESELNKLINKRNEAKKTEKEDEDKLNEMLEDRQKYTDYEVEQQETKVKLSKDDVSLAQKRLEKQAESIQKTDTELSKTRDSIKKLEDKRLEMAQIVLQQNGLNSKKGDELNTINKAIGKLEEQKKKLQETTPIAQRNTGQYKDAVSAIDSQIGKLQSAKTKVEEITGAAKKMNAELGEDVQKWVKVYVQQQTSASKNLDKYKFMEQKLRYHTGGLVGRQQMPMLHMGGLASQFASAPNHNEVDVRLLRNEMVLTEAQQANLMRMIDAGMTTGTKDGSPSIGRQFNNDVKVYANNAEFTEEDLVKSLQRLGALYGG